MEEPQSKAIVDGNSDALSEQKEPGPTVDESNELEINQLSDLLDAEIANILSADDDVEYLYEDLETDTEARSAWAHQRSEWIK